VRIGGGHGWHGGIRRGIRRTEMSLRRDDFRSRSSVCHRGRGVVKTRLGRSGSHVRMDRVGRGMKGGWRDRIIVGSEILSDHWIVRSGIMCWRREWTGEVRTLRMSEEARCAITARWVEPARNKASYLWRGEVRGTAWYLVLTCRNRWRRVVHGTVMHRGDTGV
jgi:hypothetical protein